MYRQLCPWTREIWRGWRQSLGFIKHNIGHSHFKRNLYYHEVCRRNIQPVWAKSIQQHRQGNDFFQTKECALGYCKGIINFTVNERHQRPSLDHNVPKIKSDPAFVGRARLTCTQWPASVSKPTRTRDCTVEKVETEYSSKSNTKCVSKWHIAFAPSLMLMWAIPVTCEQNHIFDVSLIDIDINCSLILIWMMFKTKEHWTLDMVDFIPEIMFTISINKTTNIKLSANEFQKYISI